MKDSMSNIDIRLILPELREAGEEAFIKNIYQYDNLFVLKLYKSGGGTSQLLVEPGRRIHLTEYSRKAPRQPPQFCTVLRKYLREKRVISIKQHDLDRIVIIEVGDDNESYKLVAEMFGTGNLLLLDPKDTIFIAMHYKRMKDRNIVPKELYEFPPQRGEDLFTVSKESLDIILRDSNANIVRTLASRLNLDSLSCEEICALSAISPKIMTQEMDTQTMSDLERGLSEFKQRLMTDIRHANIVLNNEPTEDDDESGYVTFLPFEFKLYEELPTQTFESFSKAIDEFFGVSPSELEDEQLQDAVAEERVRLQRIIDKQNESIESLVSKAEKMRVAGELIYSYFTPIQEVLETVTKARTDGVSWEEIIQRLEEGRKRKIPSATMIEQVIPSQGQIMVNLNGTLVALDIRLTAQDNASLSYEQAKKAEAKVNGARMQIERTKAKMEKLESIAIEPETKKVPLKTRKKRWYEKFHWFISSEGYLVIGGRDAKSNENVAKYQMSPNDVFLHASIHGAPYTLIKVPDEAPGEKTLREAAQFAVTFSRAWQDGLSSGDAFWVNPEQVSFTPPSGEYLPAGSVMLYGTKNYIRNVSVELSVGILLEEEYAIPVSGPPSAIEAQTQYHVRIEPGDTKKGQIVKDVINYLKSQVPENKIDLISQIPQEDIMRVLPSGEGRVVV